MRILCAQWFLTKAKTRGHCATIITLSYSGTDKQWDDVDGTEDESRGTEKKRLFQFEASFQAKHCPFEFICSLILFSGQIEKRRRRRRRRRRRKDEEKRCEERKRKEITNNINKKYDRKSWRKVCDEHRRNSLFTVFFFRIHRYLQKRRRRGSNVREWIALLSDHTTDLMRRERQEWLEHQRERERAKN